MCWKRKRPCSGFTLLELMIVVTIIGLLAVMAIPAVWKARRRSQNTAFVNDLRILSGSVFEEYAIFKGDYPPEAAPGVVPAGIDEYLNPRVDWAEGPPIGGLWDWDRAPTRDQPLHGCYAGLSVHLPSRTSSQMRDIDARIDDGNLNTGNFRRKFNGYIYILEHSSPTNSPGG